MPELSHSQMIEIQNAEYVGDYKVKVLFNNGATGIVNLEDSIVNDSRTVFSPLKDKNIFKTFDIAHKTITWDNELDFAPEYLFYLAFKETPALQEQFKVWGYKD